MKKWIFVTITIYANYPHLTNGRFFYTDEEAGVDIDHKLSYEEAMKSLRKAEKLLGRVATMKVNEFAPDIYYKEIYGYINWE